MNGFNPTSILVAVGGSAVGMFALLVMFLEHRRSNKKRDKRNYHAHRRS
jgi:hypothetical protein